MPSRLGEPAPQARTGAARYASPAPKKEEEVVNTDVLTSKRQNGKTVKSQKTPMTIRLLPSAIERLNDLERLLRRSGLKAHQASASEIVGALLITADPDALRTALS